MTDQIEPTEAAPEPTEARSLSPLEIFLVKLGATTCAAILFFYVVFSLVAGFVQEKMDQLAILKGGADFWITAEAKLYKLASADDIPPEKKAQIISALRTLSQRYKPYIDALAGDEKNREPGH
jgi:hypothetical protein